jgi:hypothetical protein
VKQLHELEDRINDILSLTTKDEEKMDVDVSGHTTSTLESVSLAPGIFNPEVVEDDITPFSNVLFLVR